MGTVIFDVSMSLDGFMTASGRTAEEPMGPGGQRLHEWAMGEDEPNRSLLERWVAEEGAAIVGRETYDTSVPWWGADGPSGPARNPLFVATHEAPADSPEGSVYTFVTDGIESALEQAKAVAGGKNVTVMGGAELGRQYIAAGLVDEIQIHLVPVLFGAGTKMFDGLADDHIQLETVEVIQTPAAIHLRFRVLGRGVRTDG
jgi:dihydrofolate reductase